MHLIPEVTKATIDNYVSKRYRPGGFVTAVLANDLMGALGKADDKNRHFIFAIASYVYNEVPLNLWGSYEIVERHLSKKGEENENI